MAPASAQTTARQHRHCKHLVRAGPNRLAARANKSLAAILSPSLRLRQRFPQRGAFPLRFDFPASCRRRLAPEIAQQDYPKVEPTVAPHSWQKIILDHGLAHSARGRFAQPVFHQHLLDTRQAHLLMPGFLQSLLNHFQFPDAFPQNDQQDFPAQLRGELPSTFGASALRNQTPDALVSKILNVFLYRVDMPSKGRRQILLRSQPAFVQLHHREPNAPFIAGAPTHVRFTFQQHAAPPIALDDLNGLFWPPSRKIDVIHRTSPFWATSYQKIAPKKTHTKLF